MGKKMEGESADSVCVDGRWKVKGKEEILAHRLHGKWDGSDEKTVRQRNHDKD